MSADLLCEYARGILIGVARIYDQHGNVMLIGDYFLLCIHAKTVDESVFGEVEHADQIDVAIVRILDHFFDETSAASMGANSLVSYVPAFEITFGISRVAKQFVFEKFQRRLRRCVQFCNRFLLAADRLKLLQQNALQHR
jgi:hypothetical protein